MFILYAIVVGLIVGRLSGGRVERLGDIRFRWAALAFAGVVVRSSSSSRRSPMRCRARSLAIALYVGSTAAVLCAVVRNIRLTGLPLVAVGAGLNLVAIVANGGLMPATPGAVAAAGLTVRVASRTVTDDPAPWFVDRFALPAWPPFSNVFSIGDVLIGIGIAVAVAAGMHARRGSSPAATAPR
jgi:hypothetical protein